MKLLVLTVISFFSFLLSYSQCDSTHYEIKGTFLNGNKNNLKMTISEGAIPPSRGNIVSVSKYGEKKMFGKNMTFWLEIADAEVIKATNESVTMKVIQEKSEIMVNGKKKDHFVKNTIVKAKWSEKAKIIPHLIMDKKDTVETGQYFCDQKTGEWKVYYPFGKLKNVAHYNNDTLHGSYVIYFENGQVKEQGEYVNGKLQGPVKMYYENGALKKEMTVVDGKINGVLKKYFDNGQINTIENFKNGKVHGPVVDYYENGYLSFEGQYNENGELHGKVKMYFKDHEGKVKIQRVYDNGKKTGNYKEYYSNGQLFIKGYTVNNKFENEFTSYYKNGELKTQGNTSEGTRTGKWKSYYPNGELKEEVTLNKNSKDGSYINYNKEGQLLEKGSYKDNIQAGNWEGYYENGDKKYKGSYDEEGNKTGKWLEWDKEGKKTKTKY